MYILSLKNIYKKYESTGIAACDNVSLNVVKGEILAVVGENGAGKSTLMKIIYGIEKPDSGIIEFLGHIANIQAPKDALKLGIGMVHQYDRSVRELTVLENIILGNEPKILNTFIDFKKAKKTIENIIKKYNFNININSKVKSLNINQIKQTAILKTLYQNAKLIILDEPTASMAIEDAKILYKTLYSLRKQGVTIIIITHRIKEIMSIADRISVMKNGNIENIYKANNIDSASIINMIAGEYKYSTKKRIQKMDTKTSFISNKKTILKFDKISFLEDVHNKIKLKDISFKIHEGEIVALTALEGNGLREMEDIATGFIKPTSGHIFYKGKDITKNSTFKLRKLKNLSYIPSDRDNRGVCPEATVEDNIIINKRRAFSNIGILNYNDIKNYTNMLLEYMNIKAKYNQIVKTLSGGNIQRLIISRELKQIRDYIICAEPTQGIDVKSSMDIHNQIINFKKASVAILLISSDINEVLELADKIIILYRGAIIKTIENKANLDERTISKYMAGMKNDQR